MFRKSLFLLIVSLFIFVGCVPSLPTDPTGVTDITGENTDPYIPSTPAQTPGFEISNLRHKSIEFPRSHMVANVRVDYTGADGGIKEFHVYTNQNGDRTEGAWHPITSFRYVSGGGVAGTVELGKDPTIGIGWPLAKTHPGSAKYVLVVYLVDKAGRVSNTLTEHFVDNPPWP